MFKYPVRIREAHIDTLGHMNNATYLALLEEARWELLTTQGWGMKVMQERQQGPIILDVTLKFLREVLLRETITITTELIDYQGKVGHLGQKMLKADGTVAAEAVFTFGFFDMRQRRLLDPSNEWLKAVGAKPLKS